MKSSVALQKVHRQRRARALAAAAATALLLAACQPHGGDTGAGDGIQHRGSNATAPFGAIAPDETLRFTGTEPFWGGSVTGTELIYTIPSRPGGTRIAVSRFAGNSGLGFSGSFEGKPFDMAVTRGGPYGGQCSDGMSDRAYPYSVTLQVSGETRAGCAWTDRKPFTGGE